jgi:16S rRNA (cytidine1402-2'-O)-methyltransferase
MEPGKLILVPTPVGNLEDITLRAIKVLKSVDLILAEDTRTSSKLLNHLEIHVPMRSHHQHNEHHTSDKIIEQIQNGSSIALISDAGTPAISDPGFLLVRACAEAGVHIECLPGPTAIIPALVLSALPCDRFYFEGFLPHKKGRQTRWKFLAEIPSTFAIYESPHRVVKSLQQALEFVGNRRCAVIREISKKFEEVQRGTVEEMITYYTNKNPKGEFVIVFAGKEK